MMLSEKYRPKTLDEIVGQKDIVQTLKKYLNKDDFPHMLFVGKQGTGKTSTAYAFAHDKGLPIIEFNASDDRTLEFVRERIKPAAMSTERKIILLDEFDAMTPNAQFALRRIMEKSVSTRFILTANNENSIIDPIKSRCAIFRFKPIPKEDMIVTVVKILKNEGIKFKSKEEAQKVVNGLVELADGDLRRLMNILEQVITEEGVNIDYLKSVVSTDVVDGIIKTALDGDLNSAIIQLQDLYVGVDVQILIQKFFSSINKLDLQYRAVGLMELARAEQSIKSGAHPLIQLSSVLARLFYEKYSRAVNGNANKS